MKILRSTPICCLLAITGLYGCNSERVTSSPSSLRKQEVVRLRAANPTQAPLILGRVQGVDEAGRHPIATALVSVDGQAYYTNEVGAYSVTVAPGSHELVVEHTGVRPTRITVNVARGDSMQVNFYLRYAD